MALDAVKKAGVKLQIGFVRRFDHNHRGVYDAVRSGKIGTPHILRISSRDPQPPTIAYVRRSGGIFYDMMIHDFDMIRFLAGCEVTEVYAKGAVLVDPAIGAEGAKAAECIRNIKRIRQLYEERKKRQSKAA